MLFSLGDSFVDVCGYLTTISHPITIEMAREGLGSAFVFRDYCLDEIAAADPVEALTDYDAAAFVHSEFI